jgi:hypothetical protein
VRIESGDRKITALELMRLAELLDVPLAHFVTRPPTSVVSHRTRLDEDADSASRERYKVDVLLEAHARNAEWLVGDGFLAPPDDLPDPAIHDEDDAVRLARQARELLGVPSGPIGPLATAAERFGLYLVVVDRDVDGASMLLDRFGVAVIGESDPGRRRWTGAHELGHHLPQDAYHTDVGVAASRDERERIIDRFAAEFLLPEADLRDTWNAEAGRLEPRARRIRIAALYRVSWSAVVGVARRAGLGQARSLRVEIPVRGEFLAVCGSEPLPDLAVGTTGAEWRKAVLAAWTEGAVTGPRAVELLYGAIGVGDLPSRTLPDELP